MSASPKQAPFPQVPDHELLRCIGSGSFGEVWLAKSIMGTYRAVKFVYRQTFKDARPFEREFRGVQRFEPISRSHEGLVDILQVGRNEQAEYFYYVMELADDLIAGQNIFPGSYEPKTLDKELARRRRLPFNECLHVGLSLTAALAHVHKHQLIHRDIKPSNIIFVNGIPKIADIGLVGDVGKSQSFPGGTLGFIPPEGPGAVQADVYALGKVLYEISTAHDRLVFPELPTQLDEISDQKELLEFNEVVVKACETELRKRYKSAEEMHGDLVLLQAGKSIKRLRSLERRFDFLIKIGLVVAVLMVLAAGAYYEVYHGKKIATQALAESYVALGTQSIDAGDLIGSLPRFAEGLALDEGDAKREMPHRMRIAAVLRRCPKVVQLFFENSPINYAEMSPYGPHLVTACNDGTATVWNATNEVMVCQMVADTTELLCASFSRDGRLVVTAGVNHTARVWNALTGQPLSPPLIHPRSVFSARFNPAGDRIVTACGDGHVRIWNWSAEEAPIDFADVSDPVRYASFSPDGRRIVTATANDQGNSRAQVWEVATGKTNGPGVVHGSWVYQASFSPDGRYIVTASFDRSARVYDTETGQVRTLDHPQPVRSAQFSPDGRYIVTACWGDYTARVWNAATGKEVSPPLKHSGNVMHASFAPDSRRIITASRDRIARVWDLSANDWLPAPVQSVYSRDGTRYATISNTLVQAWDAATGNSVAQFLPNARPLDGVILNRDGSRLLTLSSTVPASDQTNTVAQLWDPLAGKALGPPFVCDTTITSASLSPDGRHMVTITGSVAQTWDTMTGRLLAQLQHNGKHVGANFSPSGRQIVTFGSTTAHIWDVITGKSMGVLAHRGSVSHAEFSPDGRRLVTSCTDDDLTELEAQVWDAARGQPIGAPLRHRDGVLHASFSPNGELVVTASEDRTAQVWVAATGKRLGRELRHNDQVLEACFSPDGRWIVTACGDGTARVWDAETREPLTPPLKHPRRWVYDVDSWHVQFIANGRGILTTIVPGESFVWDSPPDKHSIHDLTVFGQLLSGHQSDRAESALPLARDASREVWQRLRSRYPADFSFSPDDIRSWHQREAQACEPAKLWTAAVFHWDRAIELDPGNQDFRAHRDHAQAESLKGK